MKIGIVGAGAMGGFYGAKLARAGFDIHFLMRRDCAAVMANGLSVKSAEGDFTVRAPCYESAEEIGRCDLVIVGLKTTDNAQFETLIEPVMDKSSLILTLQNGMGNEEQLAAWRSFATIALHPQWSIIRATDRLRWRNFQVRRRSVRARSRRCL